MTCAASVAELAELCEVNRRRISKWRADLSSPAPDTLDLDAWREWLGRTGRRRIALRLAPATANPGEQAAGAAASEPVSAALDDIATLDPSKRWAAEKAREQALLARLQRQQLEGSLIPLAKVESLLRGVSAALVESLARTVWDTMRPDLDQVDPTHLRRLRAAHDRGIILVRDRLRRSVQEHLCAVRDAV